MHCNVDILVILPVKNPVKYAFCSISYRVAQRYQRFPKHKIIRKAVVALDVGTEGL